MATPLSSLFTTQPPTISNEQALYLYKPSGQSGAAIQDSWAALVNKDPCNATNVSNGIFTSITDTISTTPHIRWSGYGTTNLGDLSFDNGGTTPANEYYFVYRTANCTSLISCTDNEALKMGYIGKPNATISTPSSLCTTGAPGSTVYKFTAVIPSITISNLNITPFNTITPSPSDLERSYRVQLAIEIGTITASVFTPTQHVIITEANKATTLTTSVGLVGIPGTGTQAITWVASAPSKLQFDSTSKVIASNITNTDLFYNSGGIAIDTNIAITTSNVAYRINLKILNDSFIGTLNVANCVAEFTSLPATITSSPNAGTAAGPIVVCN
jgi:hypothetical protein